MITAIIFFSLIAVVLLVVLIGLKTLQHFGISLPLYVATVQAVNTNASEMRSVPLLTDARQKFAAMMRSQINALPMNSQDKQQIYRFVISSDEALSKLLQGEKIPVSLTGVTYGALTVTFRLRLREFSRPNLDRLMKMEGLISQALCVESVRLMPGAGWIDCEVSSPTRAAVSLDLLARRTSGTTVALGVDSSMQPATIDISQHGLIAAIAPSRRGKTQAIRTALYLLKRANPSLNIVVVAFKTEDWKAFSACATLIVDSQELKQFQSWLLPTMYGRAKRPVTDRWIVVFDDLANLLTMNPELQASILQISSLGAGTGITTIVSTQFTGKDSGGVAMTANATARLLFKPSSNMQGARDGGMAGLGLDQLSTRKGDALLVVDGDATRVATAMTDDRSIEQLRGGAPVREWLKEDEEAHSNRPGTLPTALGLHPNEALIEKLNGWLIERGNFDWEEGKFNNRSEALRRLGWSNNGRTVAKLAALEEYIAERHDANMNHDKKHDK